jgi:radical SAM protein with 4Fe4S-binding SPASM domain
MMKSTDAAHTLGFTGDEIMCCLQRNGLLSIELEFTRKCNLRCIYCYSTAGEPRDDELGTKELKSVIYQSKELGAKKIILLGGGEPLLYEDFEDIVLYIHSLGLKQVLFTNGTLLNKDIARFMLRKRVSIIIKQNSFNPEIQDMLAGIRGAFENIQRGIKVLMDAGYPHGDATLGIQTIICRQNIHELPSMWIWARENRIIPYFELLTLQGRAKNIHSLEVPASDVKALFEHLENIDKMKYGITWRPYPTIAAFSCKRHLYSCLINSQGHVQPCTGIDISVGNIRNKSLKEILNTSEIIKKLRNVYEYLEGQCRECEYGHECYGCRGNAYQLTGNYLASDPSCWRNNNGAHETAHSSKQWADSRHY